MAIMMKAAAAAFIAALAVAAAPAEARAQQPEGGEVSIRAERQFAGSPLPLAESGGYVSYELTVSNGGSSEIGGEGHELLVRLSSEGGRSDSQAAFSVGRMGPGEGRLFHAGPFKIAEGGLHSFNASLTGPVAARGAYVDSFVAYGAGAGTALAAGAAVAAAGLGLIILQRVRR